MEKCDMARPVLPFKYQISFEIKVVFVQLPTHCAIALLTKLLLSSYPLLFNCSGGV